MIQVFEEKAAVEARERTSAEKVAESREKEARDKAALAKAQVEACHRVEHAIVARVTAKARDRAVA